MADCNIDCSDYIWKAKDLDSKADQSSAYGEFGDARAFRAEAHTIWDHLYRYHPQVMEDLRSY